MKPIIATAILMAASTAHAVKVADAMKFCMALDNSGLSSEPCVYDHPEMRLSLDMSRVEASKFCRTLPILSRQMNLDISGLRVVIKSPYSAGSLAFCNI